MVRSGVASAPSVMSVLFDLPYEGKMASWNEVSDAHCHATDSFVRDRHAELCCCGVGIGRLKVPLSIGMASRA